MLEDNVIGSFQCIGGVVYTNLTNAGIEYPFQKAFKFKVTADGIIVCGIFSIGDAIDKYKLDEC